MSILADACAGETRARITDRRDAYAKLTNLLVASHAERHPPGIPYEAVVPLTLNIIQASDLNLPDLIRFREREEKETNGYALRELRHRYVDRISEHVRTITKYGASKSDREELDRLFEEEMKDDLSNLRRELGWAKIESLFSTSVITTAVISASTIALMLGAPQQLVEHLGGTPITSAAAAGLIAAGGVFAANSKYASNRKSIIQKHPMAYMYELGGYD